MLLNFQDLLHAYTRIYIKHLKIHNYIIGFIKFCGIFIQCLPFPERLNTAGVAESSAGGIQLVTKEFVHLHALIIPSRSHLGTEGIVTESSLISTRVKMQSAGQRGTP